MPAEGLDLVDNGVITFGTDSNYVMHFEYDDGTNLVTLEEPQKETSLMTWETFGLLSWQGLALAILLSGLVLLTAGIGRAFMTWWAKEKWNAVCEGFIAGGIVTALFGGIALVATSPIARIPIALMLLGSAIFGSVVFLATPTLTRWRDSNASRKS